ncbi:MAG TPA: hypothetical protein VFD36_08130, partial [Kofleriaceae bacterium]|nr:hypothetical protein [Kofleriaceae bacterium]
MSNRSSDFLGLGFGLVAGRGSLAGLLPVGREDGFDSLSVRAGAVSVAADGFVSMEWASANGDAAEGDAADGDAAEGDAAEGDAAEGDAADGDAAEGDA